MVRWCVFLPTAALLLLAGGGSSAGGEKLNPGDYATYNRNYLKIGIIVWDEDLGVGNQGDCSKFANHLMDQGAKSSPLSYPGVDAFANITIGWETCTMDFKSMWFKAASLMADPDVNSRLPSEASSSTGKKLLLASQIRDILCAPILPLGGAYTKSPFSQYESSSAWVYEILTSSALFSDLEMSLDPQWTPGGISSVIQTTAPDMIDITGAHDVYGFLTSGVISPNNPVKAGCMNITFGPLKQIFQVLVWNGPNSAAPDLYDFKAGTEPRQTCSCSSDCDATEVYPRVCAGANVSLDVLRGFRTNGTDVCSLQSTRTCLSHSDCQVEDGVPRMCIQSSYEARSGTYSPGGTNAGSCYLCPTGTIKNIAAQNLFGTCYRSWGTDRSRYPYTETLTQLTFPSPSDFCPNTFLYAKTGSSGSIDEFAPAFCASTPYCTGLKGRQKYSDDGVKLCYNTWNIHNTISSPLNTLYQCVSPLFVPLNTLGDNWAWNHALLDNPINELYSLINTTALEGNVIGQIPPEWDATRAQAACVADQSGVFLNVQTTICPVYLTYFNLVDYETSGWVEGGNVDIFYPCFKIQNDENVDPNLLYGNCAEKKTTQSSWKIHTKYSSGGVATATEKDGARYATETDFGLLYNSHLPYDRATCQENGHDKFYVFIGTHGDYRTKSKTPQDIVQLEGFDLITDRMCMQWSNGIRDNILASKKNYLLPNSAYLTDDEMKLVLYAANKQTAAPISSCFGTPPWINMATARSSGFIDKVHACIKPLCKLTNQSVAPELWYPSPNAYVNELAAYPEIMQKNETECSSAQGAYWDESDAMCMPRQMSMGLRLQESVTCILAALTDSQTPPVISFEPVGNDTAKDYSFLGNTFLHGSNTKEQLVGMAYNEIQDILLHVPPVNDSETPTVKIGRIDHGVLANKICPQYQSSPSSHYFMDNIGDFISNSSIIPANYAATLQADQSKTPGAAAELVFVDGKSNSPLPRALFRTNMLRNMVEATNIIAPQIQATLPTFTVFPNAECTRTSSDKGTAVDLAYVCVQITYDTALAEATVPTLDMSYSKLCQLVTQKMIAPVDYDKVLPAVTFSPIHGMRFNKTLANSLGYSRNDFVADYVLLGAITGTSTPVIRDNGCVTAPGLGFSLRLWEKDTSVYYDATRERSAEGWFPCLNSAGTSAYLDFGVGSEPYDNPLKFPDTHVSEGVCVPCPHFNASDTNAQRSGAGCDAGELGYCAAVYNCDDGFFCADVIAAGETNNGPVVPGVCTDQGSCQDRDPVFGKAVASDTTRNELSYCSAQSQTAVAYFYDQPKNILDTLPCIGANALLTGGGSGRVIDETSLRPYAKLVLPYDCANSELLREVHNKFSQRISNVDLFGANYADGEKLGVGTYYQFFDAFCGNRGDMKSVVDGISNSLSATLEHYVNKFESHVSSKYAKIPDGKTGEVYSAWCMSMIACDDCVTERVVGGIQLVPGNQFRLAFQAGAPTGALGGSLGGFPVNSSSFDPTTPKRTTGGQQSYFLSKLTKFFPGAKTIVDQSDFWGNLTADQKKQVFSSHRTLKEVDYTHLGLDNTMKKFDYGLFDYISQTAGCAIPRPIYAGGSTPVGPLASFLATMLGTSYEIASDMVKGTPVANTSFRNLFPDITRTTYQNMNLKSFNAYEMNADPGNAEILTLMFPEFCYWTSAGEYTGNFTQASTKQKDFLYKIVKLQNFELLNPGLLLPNPFEINVIETMCRPLWDNDFEKDVFWKATMLVKDTNIFSSGQEDASFSSDPTVEADVNYTAFTDKEKNDYKWFQGLEIPQPFESPLKTTYFLKALGDITGNSIQSFAPTYHKFLGPTYQSAGKWISQSQNSYNLPEELLSYAPLMVSYENQYETLNSVCLSNIGDSQSNLASVFGAQISVYSSFELSGEYANMLGTQTINTFLQESNYVGGFQCNKANDDEKSIFDSIAVAFPGPCACDETTPEASAEEGCQFIDAPGTSCPTVPYPTFNPTPAPPTKKPTTPPPTPKPTTLGQLIAAEDEKAEREIGILAAAFFGAVFVLALLVAVLAFVLKSGKSKSEIELNVAYVEKFYREKEKEKRLLRPFRFARQRRTATRKAVGSSHVSSAFTKTPRSLNF